MVLCQTLLKDFGIIILSLDQRFTSHIILSLNLGRIKHNMIRTTTSRMNSSSRNTLHKLFIRNIKSKHSINLHSILCQHFIQLFLINPFSQSYHLSLRNGTRETIQNESLLASRTVNVILDDVHHNIITHQSTCIHCFFGTKTIFSAYNSFQQFILYLEQQHHATYLQ